MLNTPTPSRPGTRRPPDLAMSQDDDGYETVDRNLRIQGDQFLVLPPLIYVIGLFTSGTDMLAGALVIWLVAAVLWNTMIFVRVAMRTPQGDKAVAAAVLGLGATPWLICLLGLDWLSTRTGLIVTFPLVFLCGAAGMAAAAFEWPRTRTPRGRSGVILAGAFAYALFAVLFLGAVWLGVADVGGLLTVPIVLVGGISAIAAMALFQAAVTPEPPKT